MDPKNIYKQIMELNKNVFENTFNTITVLQDQTEKMMNSLLEKTPWFSETGKKAFAEWIKAYKKGRTDFKNLIDENFKKGEDFFKESK